MKGYFKNQTKRISRKNAADRIYRRYYSICSNIMILGRIASWETTLLKHQEIASGQRIELPESILTELSHFLAREIRNFYASEEGKKYYEEWLSKHPEYIQK